MKSHNVINISITLLGFAASMVGLGIDRILPGVSGYWFLIPGIILFIVGIMGIIKAAYSKNKYRSILIEIEESRAEAAKLHIEGMQLSDERALNYWVQRVDDWRKSIYDKLYDFNPAEAGKFNTLGVFTAQLATGTKILNDKHQMVLQNLIRRIKILEDIRDNWVKS